LIHEHDLEVPNAFVGYHCGSPMFGWSPVFFFTAMRNDSEWAPRFAIFGDLGNKNAQSLTRLQEETMQGMYDAILHVIAYSKSKYMSKVNMLLYFKRSVILVTTWTM
jgi:hypothetical protein